VEISFGGFYGKFFGGGKKRGGKGEEGGGGGGGNMPCVNPLKQNEKESGASAPLLF